MKEGEQKDVKREMSGEKSEAKDEAEKVCHDKKRAREDDDGEEQPTKKLDTKPEVAAEAS